MPDFASKAVLVLGGSRGIGAAIVRRFADDAATVAFTYVASRDAADALARETGSEAVLCDSASAAAVVALIEARSALDILVINAAFGVGGDPADIAMDAVDRMIDVNVRTPYHAAVAAGRRMGDGGRIIVIGSVNGDRVPFAGATAYAMTKSAMQGLVRGLARDFGSRGITVNLVQPGPVDTDMNPADGPHAAQAHAAMAIKRHGRPSEIAGLVAYLAGLDAAFVTGAIHTIDGGFAA